MPNLKPTLLFAASAALLPLTSAVAAAPLYTMQVLGLVQQNYPTSVFYPQAINDNSVIAGYAEVKVPDNSTQPERGVLWQNVPGHYYTILGTLSEQTVYPDSTTYAINNSNVSVGFSYRQSRYGATNYPVLFNAQGIVNLGIKNGTDGFAYGINNAGQVVGEIDFEKSPGAAQEAFIYQNGVMTMLGYPAPAGMSTAAAINNNGLIVGAARFFNLSGPTHAATYFDGEWTDLGSIGGAQYDSVAVGVNDSGTVIGNWYAGSTAGSFIYQSGKMTDLKVPANGHAFSINNAGQITADAVAHYGETGLVYLNGAWLDLNTVVSQSYGWQITSAVSINNRGQITGLLGNSSGQQRSYVLTPIPASASDPARK